MGRIDSVYSLASVVVDHTAAWPSALWSAPAERSIDEIFNRLRRNGNRQTDESGVALRLPPHSKYLHALGALRGELNNQALGQAVCGFPFTAGARE